MVIIWAGRGIVVLLIFFVASAIGIASSAWLLTQYFPEMDDARAINVIISASLFLSALGTAPLGRIVLQPRVGRADTFCFIDVRYWSYILLALGLVMGVIASLF